MSQGKKLALLICMGVLLIVCAGLTFYFLKQGNTAALVGCAVVLAVPTGILYIRSKRKQRY